MGGYGSGRATTSGYLFLDVRYLQRNGFLRPGTSSSQRWSRHGEPVGSINLRADHWDVVLSYSHRGYDDSPEWKEYAVPLEWTPCHYGGSRPWFRCPASGCGRRVAILYGGSVFACRHCYQLAYDSQHETPHGRALLKTQAIRVKLGGSPGLADPFPDKPKGMHWRTYYRMRQLADEAENRSWPPWIFNLMDRRKSRQE